MQVTTDSKNIMYHVDKAFDGPSLLPTDAKEAAIVEKFVKMADEVRDTQC